jgi:NAD(P)-dependent dehydrogenase (short-subunit alcohol dehydrogenase family)
LVTGGSAGIGEAIAARLFAGGARVVIGARDPDRLADAAHRIDPSGERVHACVTDVRDPASVERLVAEAESRFGALHVAVNNAGITGPHGVNIPDGDIADWHDVIATDMGGVFFGLKYEIPALLRSGGGAIVNLSSGNGIVGVPGIAPYTAAKHGVLGLTRSAALEFAGRGVRVNAIGPGYVATAKMREMPDDEFEKIAALHPIGRMARPEEVAEFAAFLLSERAGFCTGGFYPVDGGITAA